jgi:hypothetical protein
MTLRRLAVGGTKTPSVAADLEMTCNDCGSAQVFAVAPGQEPERAGDLFTLSRGSLPQAWCEACWHSRFLGDR